MNNFIFKSASRLIKNSPIDLGSRMTLMLVEQRRQRCDLQDVKLMLNKLLVDKHLQMQVDEYFEKDEENIPEKGIVQEIDELQYKESKELD